MSRLRKKYFALGMYCLSKFPPLITEWQEEQKAHFSDLGKTGDQSKQRILLSCPLRPTQPGALTGFSQTHHFITGAQLVEIWIWGLFLICARYISYQWKPQETFKSFNNWIKQLDPLYLWVFSCAHQKGITATKTSPKKRSSATEIIRLGGTPPSTKSCLLEKNPLRGKKHVPWWFWGQNRAKTVHHMLHMTCYF